MGAPHDNSCPTCGNSTPTTPQQELEARHAPNNGVSARSLSAKFESLHVEKHGRAANSHTVHTDTSTTQNNHYSNGKNGTNSIDRYDVTKNYDKEEPILQDNDERFCLLPVKYVPLVLQLISPCIFHHCPCLL